MIESTQPVIADRTMTWNAARYGSHAETSIGRPLTQWYLAEGATIAGFELFYLLQNPDTTDAAIEVRYLLPAPLAPLVKTYTVPARSRFNIWVNTEDPVLASAEMSAIITSTNGVPVIVERAMYRDVGTQFFGAGHESAGVEAPALRWYFSEGDSGPFFDLFFLIANPNTRRPRVDATYLKPDGSVVDARLQRRGQQPLQCVGRRRRARTRRRGRRGRPSRHQRRAGRHRAVDVVVRLGGAVVRRPQQPGRHGHR